MDEVDLAILGWIQLTPEEQIFRLYGIHLDEIATEED